MAVAATNTNSKAVLPAGFTADIQPTRLITASSFGAQRRGKTRFAISACLVDTFAPVGVIPLDKNTRDTCVKFIEENPEARGRLLVPTKDLIKAPYGDVKSFLKLSRDAQAAAVETHRRFLDQEIKTLYWTLNSSPAIKTIVVDTATQLWQYIMFACYGRSLRVDPIDRSVANQEMIDMIYSCNKHLVMVHDAAEVWTVKKDEKGNERSSPSGAYKPDGCSKIEKRCNVVLEHFKRKTAKTREQDSVLQFGVRITDSQLRPDLVGDSDGELLGEECEWRSLVAILRPELLSE